MSARSFKSKAIAEHPWSAWVTILDLASLTNIAIGTDRTGFGNAGCIHAIIPNIARLGTR
jgi:hypothetical protein